jgi:putative IMPACT (imprinted ancient) family translation regulator
LLERIKKAVEDMSGVVENVDFAADVTIEVNLKKENTSALVEKLTDLTDGRVKIVSAGEKFTGIVSE